MYLFDIHLIFFFSNYLADSANVVGKSGAIQILANVIHNKCLDTEEKIKVTITLGHAMENSGLYLLYMLPFFHAICIIIYFWYKKYQVFQKRDKKTILHDIVNSFISATNRKLFLEAGNSLQDVVHILTSSEDEELVKALKYVLQISVQKGILYIFSIVRLCTWLYFIW